MKLYKWHFIFASHYMQQGMPFIRFVRKISSPNISIAGREGGQASAIIAAQIGTIWGRKEENSLLRS